MTDIQHFAELIKDNKFVMLTSLDTIDGSMHSRPMTLQQMEFDGDLWFLAGKSSEMVKQIRNNSMVNISSSNLKDFSFVSARGHAQVVKDSKKEKELWNPTYKAWFPEGLQDPDLCLIKVSVEAADYWESPSSKIIRLVGFAKAILGGNPQNTALGKQGHLSIT